MKKICTLGIDLAKNTFQVFGVNIRGKKVHSKKLSRKKLILYIANLPNCTIFMEACSGSNYFARLFKSYGHNVKLISPQFVKPFVKTNKNDRADAEAIVEAGLRPSMRFVRVKEVWEQDLQSLLRIRERLVKNRTALSNEIRGFLLEYGIIISKGIKNIKKCILDEHKEKLNPNAMFSFNALFSELEDIYARIREIEEKLEKIAMSIELCKVLMGIPGVGLLNSLGLLIALADPSEFKNGRHFAAWLGLVPRHTGTGGINTVLGISKRGKKSLRATLVHGGRAVVRVAHLKKDPISLWLNNLKEKKPYNKVSVAYANKVARIAWAMMRYGTCFDNNYKLAA